MKKILAFLVALGLIFGSGAALSVSADSDDYLGYPVEYLPLP